MRAETVDCLERVEAALDPAHLARTRQLMYDEFCKPYAQRLLDAFGSCIHWCGDGKAWWRLLITLRNLTAVNSFTHQGFRIENVRSCPMHLLGLRSGDGTLAAAAELVD